MPGSWPRPDFLADRAATTPDRTALIDSDTDESWTYRKLDDRVDAAVSRLEEHGEDCRMGLLLPPGPGFVVALYAAWRLGWTVVGLHTTLADPELLDHLERAEPDLVVCEGGTDLPDGGVDSHPVAVEDLLGTEHGTADGVEPVAWERMETALILFTSGTTGDPKAVRLTPGNLLASATASAFRLGVSPGDRWLCCLPVSHMGGLAPAVRTAVYGTTLVVQSAFDAEETVAVLDDYAITGVSLVPTQLSRLLDTGWSPSPALGTVLLGGAPASESLLDRAREAGVPVFPTYGLTETASQVATARPEETRAHPGTVGHPLAGTDVTILGDGGPVEPGERGEIVVDGPTVSPGYLDEERTADAFGERGFYTGDVGYRDGDGRLWVEGRRDDVITTGGELVAPEEVRETLASHPAIADAAVVGLSDEEWGHRVAALVVPADGAAGTQLDTGTVRSYCRDRLAAFKLPKTVAVTDQLPRTASGTVDREAVRRAIRRRE